MNLVVCHDVRSTKRRNKVDATLEAYGIRANYSVFELEINIKDKDFDIIKAKLNNLIDRKTDKILFYRLCRTCVVKSESLGDGKIFSPLDTYI